MTGFAEVADVADLADVAEVRRGTRRRNALVVGTAVAVALAVGLATLSLGAAGVTPDRVLAVLLGGGDRLDRFVVLELRMPRIVAALLVGVAFALAGAVFQSTLRNPLASPDILGISAGASLGAVWAILVLGAGGVVVAGYAFGGGLAVAVVIWFAAWRQGLHGVRFVLVGVGMAYLCGSTVSWLLARSDVREAQAALHWTVGSVADVRGDELVVLAVGVALCALALAVATRALGPLALGDDHALALGVRADAARVVLLLVAVALVALATSVAGPVAFVALIAPAVARRLVGGGGAAVAAAAAIGAVLTLGADVIGQFAIPGFSAPLGIVTGVIGAPYLLWLLARTERTRA
ncbi:FecCD family ABC transporter permease [Agromyces marinus]|uniref:Iron ABC transporter permease n=1 Tax=Agromyces marinus TaxID=1389020 RepID=A0ABM8GYY2_9MICO|nr:iron chelate uptake ABC transporter family permease subunit [Agromyces marinus]UIP58121.1 putative siderophore transport system permease protein YfhA [Agromyces marinus]BDZ53650.1 iron ABC transporter permease [Agromyces marinus]